MKILMLNCEFPPIGGGAGNAHLYLLKQFARKGDLKVDVLTSAPKPGFSTEQFSQNITIYKVGLHKKDLHFWGRIEVIEWLAKASLHYRRLLRRNTYDLAHAFFGFPTGWLCYRSADIVPYIISLRGSDVPGRHARLKLDYKIIGPLFFKPIWKRAAALVACSRGLKQRAVAFLPSVTIDVIPNGVDLDRFYPAPGKPDATLSVARTPLRLLTVGRLSVTKRVEMLIEAADILSKNGCEVRLTVAGGGALESKVRATVADSNLAGIVKIIGPVEPENMPQIYRQNDIFVSASIQEGMSNAMLEAMASGLPIVTTPCEGVDELIGDNGIVVEEARPDQIAHAVRQLADDPQKRCAMALAARKRAENFSWSAVASSYIELYQRILK